jgi:hypothetical protein
MSNQSGGDNGHRKASETHHGGAAQASSIPFPRPSVAFFASALAPPGTPTGPSPIPHAGIRAGEIVAWRLWRVFGMNLVSLVRRNRWEPGKPMQGDVQVAGVFARAMVG